MKKPYKLDLASYGREGEWVEIIDPRWLTPREQKTIQDDNPSGETIVRRISLAWHLKDDKGAELNNPAEDSFDDLPSGLFLTIWGEYRTLSGEPLPKVSSAPSNSG